VGRGRPLSQLTVGRRRQAECTTCRIVVDSDVIDLMPPSPLPPLSERRRELCSSGPNEWPALLEDLAGLGWGVDRRDLAERVGQRLFHTPAPPDDQLGLPLVLGEQGRDHFER
jgi:hypothetical protein